MTELVSDEALLVGTFVLIAFIFGFYIEVQRLQVGTLKAEGTQDILQVLCILLHFNSAASSRDVS